MKNLFKIFSFFLIFVVVFQMFISSGGFFLPTNAYADTTDCEAGWVLQWSDTGNTVSLSDFSLPPAVTSVMPGSTDFSTSSDPGVVDPTLSPANLSFVVASGTAEYDSTKSNDAKSSVKWGCIGGAVSTPGILSSQESASSTLGMESCLAAAQIAQKYAWYTTLGSSTLLEKNIGALILPKITNLLHNSLSNLHIDLSTLIGSSTLKSIFGSSQGSINLSDIFNGGGVQNLLQTQFQKGVNTQFNNIKSSVQTQLKNEFTKLGLNAAGQLTQFAKSELGLSTQVPVYDQNVQSAVNQNTEATKQVIAEQKNQELIADTRAKCNLLLSQTVETIKRSLLYQFTSETVDWIQGGGIQVGTDGKITVNPPQYFQRPLKDLADAGLNAVDNVISQIAPQLCQPFQLAVTLQIPTTQRQSNPFYQQASCTLNQVVGNIQNFYSNFRSGGWLGYQEIWLPQNNYYGASLITQQLAAQASAAAQQSVQNQMNQSNGYKNTYMCTEWDEYKEQSSSYCQPGIPNTVLDPGTGTCYALNNSFSDPNGIAMPSDASSTITNPNAVIVENGKIYTDSSRSMYYQCASSIVTQPSNIASGLAQQASQVDTNAIINAQDLTDIGTIIQNAVINKLTKVGISGIRGILQQLPGIPPQAWQILKP